MKEAKDKPKVLLVQDDTLLNSLLTERLADEDVDVEICTDGADALKKIESIKPNLVVLDLILPSLSGIEILAKLRRHSSLKNTPVIILSQLSRKEDKQQINVFGVCDYFVKTEHTLAETVSVILKHLDCKEKARH